VVCPLHSWKVNLETGGVDRPKGAEQCLRTYPTRLDDDVVVVGLPGDAGSVQHDMKPTEHSAA
jgi:nitrite reductase/ring-hydroxylating ferredoxin subunit